MQATCQHGPSSDMGVHRAPIMNSQARSGIGARRLPLPPALGHPSGAAAFVASSSLCRRPAEPDSLAPAHRAPFRKPLRGFLIGALGTFGEASARTNSRRSYKPSIVACCCSSTKRREGACAERSEAADIEHSRERGWAISGGDGHRGRQQKLETMGKARLSSFPECC